MVQYAALKGTKAMKNMKEIVERLNEIQIQVLAQGHLSKEQKEEWGNLCKNLREQGYRAKRSRKDGCIVWRAASLVRTRNTDCPFVYTDVRPNDGIRTLKGDCTTRSMAFVLEGVMTYREIESRQYTLAAERNASSWRHVCRNTNGVWEKVILDLGYVRVRLVHKVTRSIIGRTLAGKLVSPVLSHSSGHVAVIDQKGAVRDTWDSRGGKCDYLLVNGCDCNSVMKCLEGIGVRCCVDVLLPQRP